MTTNLPLVLILAGGKGERFWPRSTTDKPKQLQCIYSDKTLLEETLTRARLLTTKERIFICCSKAFQKSILKRHPNMRRQSFILEPQGCNTAPIIALAALQLEERFPGSVHVILPADHYVAPPDAFCASIQAAIQAAQRRLLLTIGIRPLRPETQYGYIQAGGLLEGLNAQKIVAFTEKPKLATAQEYLATGAYYWNSGIFVWAGDVILEEFRKHAPDILEPIETAFVPRYKGFWRHKAFLHRLATAFTKIPKLPVDIAILEKSSRLAMVPAAFRWDDLGSWTSLERVLDAADGNANILFSRHNQTQIATLQSSSNIVAVDKGLVALLGVKDLVIVQEGDVLLIAQRDSLDSIKELVGQARQNPSLQKYIT